MANPTVDRSVYILAGELPGVGCGLRVRRAIGVTLERKGGPRDVRACREALFQFGIVRLALREPEPPTIVMDHDADMVRVVEGGGAAVEGRLIEVPFR